jgi:hypothetical protein
MLWNKVYIQTCQYFQSPKETERISTVESDKFQLSSKRNANAGKAKFIKTGKTYLID